MLIHSLVDMRITHTSQKNGNAVTVDTGFIAMQDDCYRMLLFTYPTCLVILDH